MLRSKNLATRDDHGHAAYITSAGEETTGIHRPKKTGAAMLDRLRSRYLHGEGMWLLSTDAPMDYEILVRGDPSAPQPEALALLERLLPRLDSLIQQGKDFLDAFVDRRRFAAGNNWFFEGIDIGRRTDEPITQFWLTYAIEGDTYGEWSVAVRESGNHYYPQVLSRRNI